MDRKVFKLENVDKLVLDNPKDEILSKPGQIYFARFNGKIVGAGAIVNTSDGWELTKLEWMKNTRVLELEKN